MACGGANCVQNCQTFRDSVYIKLPLQSSRSFSSVPLIAHRALYGIMKTFWFHLMHRDNCNLLAVLNRDYLYKQVKQLYALLMQSILCKKRYGIKRRYKQTSLIEEGKIITDQKIGLIVFPIKKRK